MTVEKINGRRASDMKGNVSLGQIAAVLTIAAVCGSVVLGISTSIIDKETRSLADIQLIHGVKIQQNCDQIKRFEDKIDEINKNINSRFDSLQEFLLKDHK